MTTILLGVAASIATEVVTWLNARLNGTVLKGDGAFILAAIVALVASVGKLVLSGGNLSDLPTDFATVWATSQVFFMVVMQALNLDIPSSTKTPSA
jgi:hypothetical protein